MSDPEKHDLLAPLSPDEFANAERPTDSSIEASLAQGRADRDAAVEGLRAPRMDSKLMFR